jgi:hypothetical protein
MLAGLSVDYIVRLEQGRAVHPSAQVLGSLARALRLTDEERDHLFRAGGVAVPTETMVPRHVTPGVQHIVDRLGEVPVAVFSAAWDTLLVNDLWLTLGVHCRRLESAAHPRAADQVPPGARGRHARGRRAVSG